MPPAPTRQSPPPKTSYLLRTLLGLVSLLILLLYVFTPNESAWKLAQAQRASSHPAEALEYVDEVLARNPKNVEAIQQQIELLGRLGKTEAAIRAANGALVITPLPPQVRLAFLQQRADLLQRIGQHRAAMRDAQEVLDISRSSAPTKDRDELLALMPPRNFHAYVIARAAAAGQASRDEVAAAQRDMQQVFAGLELMRRQHEPANELQQSTIREAEVRFLDTAAYLELAAGNLPAALRDLNRALLLCELLEAMLARNARQLSPESHQQFQRSLQTLRAVALHHRGEVLLALGNKRGGELSIEVAQRQGYSRANGTW
jgi:tetratricopeptide (TPR) repeat protein